MKKQSDPQEGQPFFLKLGQCVKHKRNVIIRLTFMTYTQLKIVQRQNIKLFYLTNFLYFSRYMTHSEFDNYSLVRRHNVFWSQVFSSEYAIPGASDFYSFPFFFHWLYLFTCQPICTMNVMYRQLSGD